MKTDTPTGHLLNAAILCAHPDAEVPPFLREALKPAEVALAANGYEALRSINSVPYDAYVLDYWLPDWSGVNLCREIRKEDPNVPICIYSKARSQEPRKRALRAGADLFLNMPHDPDLFRQRVLALMQSRQQHMDRARLESERAIEAELERQAAFTRGVDTGPKASASRLQERQLRTRALSAFLGAGGTCASFQRTWHLLYPEVARRLNHKAAQAA